MEVGYAEGIEEVWQYPVSLSLGSDSGRPRASLQSLLGLLLVAVLVFLKHTVDAVPGVVVQTSQVPNRLRALWLCVIAVFRCEVQSSSAFKVQVQCSV